MAFEFRWIESTVKHVLGLSISMHLKSFVCNFVGKFVTWQRKMGAQETTTVASSGDVEAVKKVVRFNDVVEVFEFEKAASKCLMLIQEKYADLLMDKNDRRICQIARLTRCTIRLNMVNTTTAIIRRNKHGEMCFTVTVKAKSHSDLQRFKNLMRNKFPDILFTHA